jgi:protein transport protein SEC23
MATFKKANDFYNGLLPVARKCNSSIVLFAFSCDQFGFAEMRNLITKTGGFCASHELFHSNVFKDSFRNFFNIQEGYIDKCFGGKLNVSLSAGFKVQGLIGCCLSENAKDAKVSDVPMGEAGTTSWYLGTFDRNSTYTLVLESDKQDDLSLQNKPFTIQFRTCFKDGYGQMKLRVTTVQRRIGNLNKDSYAQGFDQEAAILMTARCALSMAGMMDQKDITKWIDKRLIKVYTRFGEFTRHVPSSFRIHESFELVPQFFFYLRKSTFILNFAISVDEMHYNRMVLLRENISNSLVMIQPSLLEYTCDLPDPHAVICDISVMKDDVVILFDAYFNVVIWHGKSIKEWRDMGYHEDPDYATLKSAMENPVEDSKVF